MPLADPRGLGPSPAASRVSVVALLAQRLGAEGSRSSMVRPIASSAAIAEQAWSPPGSSPSTRSSRSIVTTATGLTSTSDSKYCFWRRISPGRRPLARPAARGSRRSRGAGRSCRRTRRRASRPRPPSGRPTSPRGRRACTRLAVSASARMGRVTRRATSADPDREQDAPTAGRRAPIVSASCRADPNASSWVISAMSAGIAVRRASGRRR